MAKNFQQNDQDLENENGQRSKEDEISEKLGKLVEAGERDKGLLAKLIADPQIREVMEARQLGKKIKLVTEEADQESADSISTLTPSKSFDLSDAGDLEEMSREDFAKTIASKLVPVVGEVITKGLSGLTGKVESFGKFIDSQERIAINEEISKARESHKDFDAYRPEMLNLHRQHPTLDAESLYALAKATVGDKTPREVNTERPASSSGRPSGTSRRKAPLPIGRAGMSQLLAEAEGSIDWSDIEGD